MWDDYGCTYISNFLRGLNVMYGRRSRSRATAISLRHPLRWRNLGRRPRRLKKIEVYLPRFRFTSLSEIVIIRKPYLSHLIELLRRQMRPKENHLRTVYCTYLFIILLIANVYILTHNTLFPYIPPLLILSYIIWQKKHFTYLNTR